MRLTPLKLQRLRAGLLQIELSQRARINRCRLSELECGHLQPRADELQRLAAALGVTVAALGALPGEPRLTEHAA